MPIVIEVPVQYSSIADDAAKIARGAFESMMRASRAGWIPAHHLYFKRGRLAVFADSMASGEQPEGWELGENERLPSNKDLAQLTAWITARVRRLPCLPLEG